MWKLEQHLTWDFFSCTPQTTVPSFCFFFFLWDTSLSFMSLKNQLVFFKLYYGYHLYDHNAHMPVGYKSTWSFVGIHLKRCALRELETGWIESCGSRILVSAATCNCWAPPPPVSGCFKLPPRLTQPDLCSSEHGWPKCFLTHLARTELYPVT